MSGEPADSSNRASTADLPRVIAVKIPLKVSQEATNPLSTSWLLQMAGVRIRRRPPPREASERRT